MVVRPSSMVLCYKCKHLARHPLEVSYDHDPRSLATPARSHVIGANQRCLIHHSLGNRCEAAETETELVRLRRITWAAMSTWS